jgi:hypothetical protein
VLYFRFAFLKRGIPLMNKRSNDRHQVLMSGTILFPDSKLDCAVHDLSPAGASIEVDSQTGIPDSFDLLLADTGKRSCRVVWRKAERIGVAFAHEAALFPE